MNIAAELLEVAFTEQALPGGLDPELAATLARLVRRREATRTDDPDGVALRPCGEAKH